MGTQKPNDAHFCPFCSQGAYHIVFHYGACPMIRKIKKKAAKFPVDAELEFKAIFNKENTKIIGVDVQMKKEEVPDVEKGS